ncbi:flagellar biosynthesis protein FliQ [Pseudomonadales bacterium]|jgi:flagellar biosynthetic protein FliQ|nr:flagellar biosynthesis protein FliQ [Pseudomonadales bacterium]MDB4421241.1 flagellar biosynthesis protein FliQ [Pseudomonadales bacterium]MDB4431396.1 flagellar biosynthesis protein FliQ [Pseudomonadales bacterium]MDB4451036.1 flagellar biosynthesis protein FliQ [Pseudomonadales bacterium]MDB4824964.1 flagellar biosynthesis protein FliQ [Pseudomonadales bacterium]
MTPETVIGIFGQALFLVVVLVAAIILPSLLVGLIVSVFQAATQINEQTLSFLPRLLATLMTIMVLSPWIIQELLDLSNFIFESISYVTH